MSNTHQYERLSPFPPLAIELVRHILEHAARQAKSTSLILALVSKDVNKWTTSILYHTVILKKLYQLRSFCHTVQVPQFGAAAAVHTLVIWTVFHQKALREISIAIRSCTCLSSLFSEGDMTDTSFSTVDGSPFPSPLQLVILASGRMPPLGHPLLRNITHLCISSLNDLEDTSGIIQIHCVSLSLTHIACVCFGDGDHWYYEKFSRQVKQVLSSHSIRMVLVQVYLSAWSSPARSLVRPAWRALAKIPDNRLLVRPGLSALGHVGLVESKKTIWDDTLIKYKAWRNLDDENNSALSEIRWRTKGDSDCHAT
ncbi:hypothetical protein K439DRAFT_322864 [Ramaria rubella]|nr:hypothetical protein K439DRAFT_322864 [Ramaria rubella]